MPHHYPPPPPGPRSSEGPGARGTALWTSLRRGCGGYEGGVHVPLAHGAPDRAGPSGPPPRPLCTPQTAFCTPRSGEG